MESLFPKYDNCYTLNMFRVSQHSKQGNSLLKKMSNDRNNAVHVKNEHKPIKLLLYKMKTAKFIMVEIVSPTLY